MTVGELRNERRLELLDILKEATALLEDEGNLHCPEQLDAVAATLYFAQPIADRLAQKPRPDLSSIYGIPVHICEGIDRPFLVGSSGQIVAVGD